ncbi:hypothetical protein [Streptomyces sp. NPDC048295]|uniref:hypothetical protein n=1 Tax=Streptomyces sp. NPDC048295 TaxID=3154617 RepID=UPI003449FBFC
MTGPQGVPMPGQVRGLAAPNADGAIFVTSYDGKNLFTTVLTAVDMAGEVLWRRGFEGHPGRPCVSTDESV